MGASGTAVVANAIDIYADDKDVQQLAAPATNNYSKQATVSLLTTWRNNNVGQIDVHAQAPRIPQVDGVEHTLELIQKIKQMLTKS